MRDEDAAVLRQILTERGGFGHREHVELAWSYLQVHPLTQAELAMARAIRHVAQIHGAADRYHDTITRAWVKLVDVHRAESTATSFDEFISQNPELLDRRLLDRHYSHDVLWSDTSRRRFVAPDRVALPAQS